MNALFTVARYLMAVVFLMFGSFHFMNAAGMSPMVPSYFPGPVFWVYIVGIGHVAAALSIILGKYDKLGSLLLGVMLLILAVLVWMPGAFSDGEGAQMAMTMMLKDLGLACGAFFYAQIAKDNSVVG